MHSTADLDRLSPEQLRALAVRLMTETRTRQILIDKLAHEMPVLKRLKFAAAAVVRDDRDGSGGVVGRDREGGT